MTTIQKQVCSGSELFLVNCFDKLDVKCVCVGVAERCAGFLVLIKLLLMGSLPPGCD